MRSAIFITLLIAFNAIAKDSPDQWRTIPLIKDGKVSTDWLMVGYGSMAVDDGALRTEADERGLGLFVYTKEKLGDCQIRIVFKAKDAKSNSGVYVRIDDGILKAADKNHAPAKRDKDGKLTKESLQIFEDASDKELGAWYAVHHGYEVQICDGADPGHRTGAIYSLAKSEQAPGKSTEWRTMIITLRGETIRVDIDDKRVSEFDANGKDLPPRKQWHEPKREPKRPTAGYIGLQTHDPGDIVYFKDIAVRALGK